MKKTDEDVRRDIESLEKLIEEVHSENKKDLERLRKETPKPAARVIRIDLSREYSASPATNLVVGFLVNFILFLLLLDGLGLAEADGVAVYAGLAVVFTLYETVLRRYLFKHQLPLLIHSSGLILFFLHLVFFYVVDLVVLPRAFSFLQLWNPAVFLVAFTLLRFFLRSAYAGAVKALSGARK